MKTNKFVCFVQARLSSSRLPNKTLKKIHNLSLLEIIYSRCNSKKYDFFFLIPEDDNEKKLEIFLIKKKIPYLIGSLKNVLKRYYFANQSLKYKHIIRCTGDNIFLDHKFIEKQILVYNKNNTNNALFTNRYPSFPKGLTLEIFNNKILNYTYKNASTNYDKEHVTPYMYRNFKIINSVNIKYKSFNSQSYSIDTIDEYKTIKLFIESMKDSLKINTYRLAKLFYEYNKKL